MRHLIKSRQIIKIFYNENTSFERNQILKHMCYFILKNHGFINPSNNNVNIAPKHDFICK